MRRLMSCILAAHVVLSCCPGSASAQGWSKIGHVPTDPGALTFASDGSLFCAGPHGLYRSADHGVSWAYDKADSTTPSLWPGFVPYVLDVATGPGGRILVGFEGPYPSLVISSDNGSSWTYCTPAVGNFDIPESIAIGANGDLYALCSLSSDGATGVYRSTDAGASWTRTSLSASITLSLDDVSAGPDGALYAIEGANKSPGPWHLFRSNDHGSTWTPHDIGHQPFSGHPLGHDLWADDKGHVVVGCYDGIAASADGGASWHFWQDPSLGALGFTSITSDAAGNLFAGYQGSSHGIVWSSDHGYSWNDYSAGLDQLTFSYRAVARDGADAIYTVDDAGTVYRTSILNLTAAPHDPAATRVALRALPNPARCGSDVRLSLGGTHQGPLEVFDAAGRLVSDLGATPDGAAGITIHTVGWRPGLYLVRGLVEHRPVSAKLLLMR